MPQTKRLAENLINHAGTKLIYGRVLRALLLHCEEAEAADFVKDMIQLEAYPDLKGSLSDLSHQLPEAVQSILKDLVESNLDEEGEWVDSDADSDGNLA